MYASASQVFSLAKSLGKVIERDGEMYFESPFKTPYSKALMAIEYKKMSSKMVEEAGPFISDREQSNKEGGGD